MITLRKSSDRGYFDHGWLKTYHSFSFGDYFDPNHMNFGPLRVINEDFIHAGAGFPTHGHRDMEIITYVLEGAVAHKDSTGGEGVIHPGEIQTMTAGRGVRHSEYNGLKDKDTHLYQIWIEPSQSGLTPRYEQKDFAKDLDQGEPVLLVSADGQRGSIKINQDATLWARRLKPRQHWNLTLDRSRLGWLQIAKGSINFDEKTLKAGDGAGISEWPTNEIVIESGSDGAEVLWFDLKEKS